MPRVDWYRELMPIDFSIEEGSINLGNDATPMVLIGHFHRSTGSVNYTDVSLPAVVLACLLGAYCLVKVALRSSQALGRFRFRAREGSHSYERGLLRSTAFTR